MKLQYFGHLMWTANSLEKTLMLEKIKGKRRWLDNTTESLEMDLSKFQEIVKDRKTWCVEVHGVTKNWTWLSDWTTVSYAATWMDLEIILPSEVSQKEKDKRQDITYIWNLKYNTNKLIYKSETDYNTNKLIYKIETDWQK